MTKPNVIEAYEDVRLILDIVIKYGGGSYKLETEAKAKDWRRRAYKFRSLVNKQSVTTYNAMVLRVKRDTVLFDENRVEGQLFDGDGNSIDIMEELLGSVTKETEL